MAAKEKNKKKTNSNVNVWFLFVASSVIIIFFLWYFLIYVNGNEKLLIQKSFRVLNQVGDNLKARENSFRGLTNSKSMRKQLEDSTKNNNRMIKRYFSGLEIAVTSKPIDRNYFYFSKDHQTIKHYRTISKIKGDSIGVFFKINKKDFFKPIERKDVFEEIIIVKSNSTNNKYEFVYSSFPGDLDVKNLDSLIATNKGLSSGIVKDIEISGIDYRLFMTQIQLRNNELYYIGGVINNAIYMREIRSINAYVALLLLIIFFIFLFSIPLIKLKMLSENLQLKMSDLTLSGLSIVFGAFFTLLVVLSLFSQYQREENVNNSLANLSDSIRVTFIREIEQINLTLDKLKEVTRTKYPNVVSDKSYGHEIKTKEDFCIDSLSYKYYKLFFDLDTSGQQNTISTSRLQGVSSWDNYSFRRYFRESGEWKLDSLQIMLDFIVSNTSGEKLGVVSKRNEEFRYVITSRLYSVINTILPLGYGFCVIDKMGNVKFHSNSGRMLQENFIEESENSSDLRQAINGNLKTHFSANYVGKSHLGYIQPINSLPMYLVTFYDESYSHSLNLKTTNLTFIFSLLVLIMFFIMVIGSWLVIRKKTELNRNLDLIEFIKPTKRNIEKFRHIYITNILAIALMISACLITNPENIILIIFLFIITQIVSTYCYMNFISWNHFRKYYLMGALFPSSIMISLLLYLVFKDLPPLYIYQIFIFNAILIASNLIVIKLSTNIFSGLKDHTNFYIYFYSWVSLIVITPVFIFFITFNNYETKSDIAYKLYSYAKKEAVRNYEIDKFYFDNVKTPFHKYKNSLKDKGVYYLSGFSKSYDSTGFHTNREGSVNQTLGQILFFIKPDLDKHTNERKSLVKNLPNYVNKNIEFSDESVIIKYRAEQIHYSKTDSNYTAYYRGEIETFGFSRTVRWISFIVVILFFCYILFKLLKFVSDKVPGSSIGASLMKERFKDEIKEHINSKNNMMIQFSSRSEKMAYDNREGDKYFSKTNSTIINYTNLKPNYSSSLKDSKSTILVKGIHLDFENPQAICEKLSIINDMAEDDKVHLTLMLDCSFARIIDENELLIDLEEDKARLKQLKSLQKILESTNNKFVHLFPPLTGNKSTSLDGKEFDGKSTLKQLKEIIKNELSVSDFLRKKYEQSLGNYATKIIKEKVAKPKEKIILKIQEYATGYYESIWEACSNSEKILLYDISDDLLLNDKNIKAIRILISKGLLTYDGYIDTMNRSFRNFIVAKFESEYEEEYMKKYASTGKWANYRAPILLIVLALAFFIALQENILTNITSILPAILAALGLITKVSGVFSKGTVVQSSITQSN